MDCSNGFSTKSVHFENRFVEKGGCIMTDYNIQNGIFSRVLELGDLEEKLTSERIWRAQARKINERIRSHLYDEYSDWVRLIKGKQIGTQIVADLLDVEYAAAWRQLMRGSLRFSYERVPSVTEWLLTLLSSEQFAEWKDKSYHNVWYGKPFSGTAPLVARFFFSVLQMECDAQLGIIIGMCKSAALTSPGKNLPPRMFYDRLCSLRADRGVYFYNKDIRRIVLPATRSKILTLCLDELSDNDRTDIINGLTLRDLVTISFAFNVPLDYFCTVDYLSKNIAGMKFVTGNNQSYRPLNFNELAKYQSVLCSFARCSRVQQEEMISKAIAML